MLIVCKVAAEFHGPDRELLFTVNPDQRYGVIEAPDSIRLDPQFDWLVKDNLLSVAGFSASLEDLESDPVNAGGAAPAEEKKIAAAEKSVEAPAPATSGRKKA